MGVPSATTKASILGFGVFFAIFRFLGNCTLFLGPCLTVDRTEPQGSKYRNPTILNNSMTIEKAKSRGLNDPKHVFFLVNHSRLPSNHRKSLEPMTRKQGVITIRDS